MKKGIFYYNLNGCSEGGGDVEAMIKFAHENGIEGIQFDIGELESVPREVMMSALGKYGCEVACIHVVCRLTAADDAVFEQAVRESEKTMRAAELYGCKNVMIVPSNLDDIKGKSDLPRARERMAQGLKILTAEARKYRVKLYIENYSLTALPFATPQDITYFINSVPNINYTFDTGNFVCAGYDPAEALKTLRGHIGMVHIKDCIETDGEGYDCCGERTVTVVPFGAGGARLNRVLPEIAGECSEDAYFMIEIFSDAEREDIVRDSRYLDGLLKE